METLRGSSFISNTEWRLSTQPQALLPRRGHSSGCGSGVLLCWVGPAAGQHPPPAPLTAVSTDLLMPMISLLGAEWQLRMVWRRNTTKSLGSSAGTEPWPQQGSATLHPLPRCALELCPPSACLFVHLSVCPPACPLVCLPAHPSDCPPVCLLVCPPVCLPAVPLPGSPTASPIPPLQTRRSFQVPAVFSLFPVLPV